MASPKNRTLYQLKIMLHGISPPIWRQVQVWENATLAQLHRVLQMVMGWENYHPYEFRIDSKIYGAPEIDDERKIIDAQRIHIRDVLSGVETVFQYVYDFGDYWQHDDLLEAVLQPAQGRKYPRCIAGERSCPPEDVGGIGGYEDYVTAMTDPKHEQHQDMLQWRGRLDPEAFSVESVNRKLQNRFRPVRKKAVGFSSRHANVTEAGAPDAAQSLRTMLSESALPRKERIRIQPNEAILLELNARDRDLILSHSFADESLTGRLRLLPTKGERFIFHFTLDDLDELAGFIAFEANHAKDKKLRQELDQLCDRIQNILDTYTDEVD